MSCPLCELKEAELKAAAEMMDALSEGLLVLIDTCLTFYEYVRPDVIRYKLPNDVAALDKAIEAAHIFKSEVEKERLKRETTT